MLRWDTKVSFSMLDFIALEKIDIYNANFSLKSCNASRIAARGRRWILLATCNSPQLWVCVSVRIIALMVLEEKLQKFWNSILIILFKRPLKDVPYYGMALSVLPSVCPSVRLSTLLVNEISWKPFVRLTSHFDIALIPIRTRTLLIWGILRKTRWPPQQFYD